MQQPSPPPSSSGTVVILAALAVASSAVVLFLAALLGPNLLVIAGIGMAAGRLCRPAFLAVGPIHAGCRTRRRSAIVINATPPPVRHGL